MHLLHYSPKDQDAPRPGWQSWREWWCTLTSKYKSTLITIMNYNELHRVWHVYKGVVKWVSLWESPTVLPTANKSHSSSQAPPENVVCADKCVRTRRTHYCLSWVLNTIVHMKWSSFYKDVILSLSSNGEIRSRQATYMLVVARQVAISRGIRYRTPNLVTEQKKLFGDLKSLVVEVLLCLLEQPGYCHWEGQSKPAPLEICALH